MEMNGTAKSRKLWKMNSTGEPLSANGIEANPLKKFTIPKIRKTTEKVYLSPCYTNTREYSFIHDTLNQCRLELKCNLQLSWQFGDTKLVHNEDLEKKFTAKRYYRLRIFDNHLIRLSWRFNEFIEEKQ